MRTVHATRLRDAIYGQAVGDALGVPYEFLGRGTFEFEGMTGGGSHGCKAGTFSDDTSMTLATCDSLRELGRVDVDDMRERFIRWWRRGDYTPDGVCFDIGNTTSTALRCGHGGEGIWDNGNGSLMRISPLAFVDATDEEIRAVSAITHAHEISCQACVDFVHILREAAERPETLRASLVERFASTSESDLSTGGYVLGTLEAALWCFARTTSYRDCVVTAVMLGEDTDTTADVAGALAGAYYGLESIPVEWFDALRAKTLIESCLF